MFRRLKGRVQKIEPAFRRLKGRVSLFQDGAVSCDISGLVDPLRVGVKPHKVAFKEDSFRGLEQLVGGSSNINV